MDMKPMSRADDLVKVKGLIRSVPFKGVNFWDIAPLLQSYDGLEAVTHAISEEWRGKIDAVVALDARGFIFGPLIAHRLKLPFVMVRKEGKLPGDVVSVTYDLEYGTDTIEMQRDALPKGTRVLVVDDVLATGGTACATQELVYKVGAHVVGFAFVIELPFLKGRAKLGNVPVTSLVQYD
ncbi:MAG: adenine phosphoribosyltransferase [Candidatus Parcubacteria bacterium]|jgi:adenine phosphoribosyltransferase